MNEDTAARLQPHGRTISTYVPGDTAEEIELAALDEARGFFGADQRLEIVHDYEVHDTKHGRFAESGKKYCASVKVRAVEPD